MKMSAQLDGEDRVGVEVVVGASSSGIVHVGVFAWWMLKLCCWWKVRKFGRLDLPCC